MCCVGPGLVCGLITNCLGLNAINIWIGLTSSYDVSQVMAGTEMNYWTEKITFNKFFIPTDFLYCLRITGVTCYFYMV